MNPLILIILIVLLFGAPYGAYSYGLGWGPSGGLFTILLVVLIIVLLRGRL